MFFARGYPPAQKIMSEVFVCSDAQVAAESAAQFFFALGLEMIKQNGRYNVALAGGASPRRFHEQLAAFLLPPGWRWDCVHIFFSDERSVAPASLESNYHSAYKSFIAKIKIPPANVHRLQGEHPDLDQAAQDYEKTLRAHFTLSKHEIPCLDLVCLGLGIDGHTASLFPGSAALAEKQRWVVKNYAQKTRSWRLTFTLPLIKRSKNVLFLVTGKEKSEVLDLVLNAKDSSLPATQVALASRKLVWFVDKASLGAG